MLRILLGARSEGQEDSSTPVMVLSSISFYLLIIIFWQIYGVFGKLSNYYIKKSLNYHLQRIKVRSLCK